MLNGINIKNKNEFRLYKGIINDIRDYKDNRIRVRIVPHMLDFVGDMEELLPWYPPFFKNQIFNGISEKKATKNDIPTQVWVLALPDFTVGYILGYANAYEHQTDAPTNFLNFKDLLKILDEKKCVPVGIDYSNLYVQYFSDNYIELVDTKLGAKIIVNDRQTMFVLAHNVIKMRLGDNEKFSELTMSNNEVVIETNLFKVRANDIELGSKGLYVVASPAIVPVTVDGVSLQQQTRIRC